MNYHSIFLGLLLSSGTTQAATFQFTLPFSSGSGIGSNFGNNGVSGTGTDGMLWGIIVDNNNNGFSTGSYIGGVSTITNNQQAISLSTASGISDDILYIASAATYNSGPSGSNELEGDFSTQGSNGTVGVFNALDISAVSAGDAFGLVWFDSNDISNGVIATTGDRYGFFTDSSYTIPGSTSTVDYSSVFIGVDPVRTANLQFVSAVPEPSSTALLGLGSVALLLRRRR